MSKYLPKQSEIAIQYGPNDRYLSISKLIFFSSDQSIHDISCYKPIIGNYCICTITEKWLLFHPGLCLCYPGFMFKTGTFQVQGPSQEVFFHPQEANDTKKCMVVAKSLTNTQHVDLEPQCTTATLAFLRLDFATYQIPLIY